ncbi:hypothetical protein D9757_000723 [Collybiopsis confluens]|uniref:BRCT domain-containing protein n=1 Tax=Collybiopsis confluens TaxID=2823264 RepID=A0A8H5I141_9AGAR|nr:hypothetical protein D9757_000723 [Collybiopsis confluens]
MGSLASPPEPFLNQSIIYLPPSISRIRREQLHTLIKKHAGKVTSTPKDATLVVTDSHRFEGWQEFDGNGSRPVCTELWLERSAILNRFLSTEYFSPDPSKLFSGVIGCAADLSPSDIGILSAGIFALGGQWRTGLTKDVSHLFTLASDSEKYESALRYQAQLPGTLSILLPQWFDDVIRLGSKLDVTLYEWPKPLVLQPSTSSASKKSQEFESSRKALFSTVGLDPAKAATKISPKPVFEGRKILLGNSVPFGTRRKTVESLIEHAGGQIIPLEGDSDEQEEVEKVSECDIFITQYRHDPAYFKAARGKKTIATLTWVFNVICAGTLSPPLDQLLHYPIPKKPIEGFDKQKITITNFTGDAREYLKQLILLMGAEFTPSMSSKNTALIAAHVDGTKTDRARSWDIPIVNHLWLEDCFVRWKNITVGLERYLLFPKGTDFGSCLGERRLNDDIEDPAELDRLEEEIEEEGQKDKVKAEATSHPGPLRTQDSTRDAQEAADLALSVNENGDNIMDVDVGPEPRVMSPKIPRNALSPANPKHTVSPRARTTSLRKGGEIFKDNTSAESPKRGPMKLSNRRSRILESEDVPMDLDEPISGKENDKQVIVKKVLSSRKPATVYARANARGKRKVPQRSDIESEDSEEDDTNVQVQKKPMKPNGYVQHPSSDIELDTPTPARNGPKTRDGPPPKKIIRSSSKAATGSSSSGRKTLLKSESVHLVSSERATPSSSRDKTTAPLTPTGSRPTRRAAERASQQLRDTVMPDVVSYETEMKKRRRQSSSAMPQDKDEQGDEDNNVEGRVAGKADSKDGPGSEEVPVSLLKRAKKAKAGSIRIMTTQVTLNDETKKTLEKLGVRFVTKPSECTHLIAPKILRTEKFLCALAVSPCILTEQWVHDSIRANALLAEEPYFLQDRGKWDIDLKKTLETAKKMKFRLFANHIFYVTPDVFKNSSINPELLGNVISAFGGKMVLSMPAERQLKPGMRHLITTKADRDLWKHLADKHYIHDVELVLQAVLRQELACDNPDFHIEGSWGKKRARYEDEEEED